MRHRGILRNHHSLISILHRLFDQGMIFVGLILALWSQNQNWNIYHTALGLGFGLVFLLSAEMDHLYTSWRGVSLTTQFRKTGTHIVVSLGVVLLAASLSKWFWESYLQALWIWFGVVLTLCLGYRAVLRYALMYLRSKGFNIRHAVVVGAGSVGKRLARNFRKEAWMGIHFAGFYDDHKSGDDVLGTLEQLVQDAKRGDVDRIYLTLPMRAEERMQWLVNELSDTTATVYYVPDIFVFELLHARSENINGIPTISIYDSPIEGANALVKRIEDVVITLGILSLIWPIMIACALAVKFSSKGPVFFKQNRYGIGGDPIKVWKFRSMTVMEQGDDVLQATKGDLRITKVGAFLRKTSLDELPQFFNVLMGDMSIVGPRPHATSHNEQYRKLINGYMLRHKVKPGITGWAQINGWRGETDTLYKMAKRIKFDLYYIQNWSLGFDLKIIFLTIFKGFVGKNVY
jgi:putative colanic acid biosynthesis UDP-glucose lipid carrier transferase